MSSNQVSGKIVVTTADAPAPIAPFSQGIAHNGLVYCSGSVGMDPKTNKIVEGGVEQRTIQILKNLSAVLHKAGSSLDKVIKVNVFLTSMDYFGDMNKGYEQFFKEPFPVRTCVCVKALPLNSDVEIECTGYI
ncbi:Endoribonuclease L-PSP/chorismate mutase-like protein [Xylogone sp. PMI_703]|nr:Endoribonuclease L-PSP/chorismate mutase-like protein [Xylogone sp. PMI_703]